MAGIYLHIPFCKSRCTYCDFYSTVGSPLMERYVSVLCDEARMRIHELRDASVHTIYIGGGTPSQLPVELVRRLVDALKQLLRASTQSDSDDSLASMGITEFTVEVNPDDVNEGYIAMLADMGVNRISMGIQSFDDGLLKVIGRRHTAQQAVDAVHAIRKAGVHNLSIDLMFGLPKQTLDSWRQSLDQALALRPEHLSAYALSYEPGTPLWQQRERGEVCEVDEDISVEMFACLLTAMREAGYEHYEISNFALPGMRSRHNSAYWNATPYLGLGAAAHSFDGSVRSYNPADMAAYIRAIEQGRNPAVRESLEPWERYDEQVMLALRTCDGIDMARIEREFGQSAVDHLLSAAQPHLAAGRLRHQNGHLVLTDIGIMTSDAIIRDLMT